MKIKPPKGWRVLLKNECPDEKFGDEGVTQKGARFLTCLEGLKTVAELNDKDYISHYIRRTKKEKK